MKADGGQSFGAYLQSAHPKYSKPRWRVALAMVSRVSVPPEGALWQ